MNQKPASMPIFSLSISVSSGVRQSENDGSHRVSADAIRDARSETVAVRIPMRMRRLWVEGDDFTPGVGARGVLCNNGETRAFARRSTPFHGGAPRAEAARLMQGRKNLP